MIQKSRPCSALFEERSIPMSRLGRIAEGLSALVFIIAGILGICVGLVDLFGWEVALLSDTKDRLSVILTMLSTLLSAYGIERYIWSRRNSQRLASIERTLAEASGGRYLMGEDEIYGSMFRLCTEMVREMRVVVVTTRPRAPSWWINGVADRLRQTKDMVNPAKFEVVLALDFDKAPADLCERIDARMRMYEAKDVRDLVSYNLLDVKAPVGLDVYVWDRKHAAIAFTRLRQVQQVQGAILFENQPSIAADLSDWFDAVLKSSIPYSDWRVRYADAQQHKGQSHA
jgi:hypothetical protein